MNRNAPHCDARGLKVHQFAVTALNEPNDVPTGSSTEPLSGADVLTNVNTERTYVSTDHQNQILFAYRLADTARNVSSARGGQGRLQTDLPHNIIHATTLHVFRFLCTGFRSQSDYWTLEAEISDSPCGSIPIHTWHLNRTQHTEAQDRR